MPVAIARDMKASLSWLMPPLRESYDAASVAMETFAKLLRELNDPIILNDEGAVARKHEAANIQLDTLRTEIHRITSALHLIHAPAPAVLMREIDDAVKDLASEDHVSKGIFERLAAISSGAVTAKMYCELLARDSIDAPLVIVEEINKVRRVRGLPPMEVGEIVTGTVNLDLSPAPGKIERLDAKKAKEAFPRLLAAYRAASDRFVDQGDVSAAAEMLKILGVLRTMMRNDMLGNYFWLVEASVEMAAEKGLNIDMAFAQVAFSADEVIGAIELDGESAGMDVVTRAKLMSACHFLAINGMDTPIAKAIDERFHISDSLPSAEEMAVIKKRMAGGEDAVSVTVIPQILQDLEQVQLALDKAFKEQGLRAIRHIQHALHQIPQVASTLRLCGFADWGNRLSEQEAVLTQYRDTPHNLSNADRERIVDNILYVERQAKLKHAGISDSDPEADRKLFDHEVIKRLVAETIAELTVIKRRISVYIASGTERDELIEGTEQLRQVAQALSLYRIANVHEILNALVTVIRRAISDGGQIPDDVVGHMANIVTGVEEHLVCVEQDLRPHQVFLGTAMNALAQLGIADPAAVETISVEAAKGGSAEGADLAAGEFDLVAIDNFREDVEASLIMAEEAMREVTLDHRDAASEVREAFSAIEGNARIIKQNVLGDAAASVQDLASEVGSCSEEDFGRLFELLQVAIAVVRDILPNPMSFKAEQALKDVHARVTAVIDGRMVTREQAEVPSAGQRDGKKVQYPPSATGMDPKLLYLYKQEYARYLAPLRQYVDAGKRNPASAVVTDDLIVWLHSIAGSSRSAGFHDVGHVFKAAELCWEAFRAQERSPDDVALTVLDDVLNETAKAVDQYDAITVLERKDELITTLENLYQQQASAAGGTKKKRRRRRKKKGNGGAEAADNFQLEQQASADEAGDADAEQDEGTEGAHEAPVSPPPRPAVSMISAPVFEPREVAAVASVEERAEKPQAQPAVVVVPPVEDKAPPAVVEVKPATAAAGPTETLCEAFDPQQVDTDVLDIFREEAEEVLAELAETLATWAELPASGAYVETCRRAFHTLKGSSRMALQVNPVSDLAWAYERLLNHVKDKRVDPSGAIVEACVDALKLMPAAIESLTTGDAPFSDIRTLVNRARAFCGQAPIGVAEQVAQQATAPQVDEVASSAPSAELDLSANVPMLMEPVFEEPAAPAVTDEVRSPAVDAADTADALPLPELDLDDEVVVAQGVVLEPEVAAALPVLEVVEAVTVEEPTLLPQAEEIDALEADIFAEPTVLPVEQVADSEAVAEQPEVELELGSTEEAVAEVEVEDSTFEYDEDTLGLFLDDCDVEIPKIERYMDAWEKNPGEPKEIGTLKRHMHTLKGSSRLAGIEVIGTLTHEAESLLEAVAKGVIKPVPELYTLMRLVFDAVTTMVDDARDRRQVTPQPALTEALAHAVDFHQIVLPAQPGKAAVAPVEPRDVEPVLAAEEPVAVAAVPAEEPVALAMPIIEEAPSAEQVLDEQSMAMEDALDMWAPNPEDERAVPAIRDALRAIARCGHAVADLASEAERLYAALADGQVAYTTDVFTLTVFLVDEANAALKAVRKGTAYAAPAPLRGVIETANRTGTIDLEPVTGKKPASKEQAAQPAAPVATNPAEVSPELRASFVAEADNILEMLGELVDDWRSTIDDQEQVARLKRYMHTLKGLSNIVGLAGLSSLTHEMETAYDRIAAGKLDIGQIEPVMVAAHDALNDGLRAFIDHSEVIDVSAYTTSMQTMEPVKKAAPAVKQATVTPIKAVKPAAPAAPAKPTVAIDTGTVLGALQSARDRRTDADAAKGPQAEESLRIDLNLLGKVIRQASDLASHRFKLRSQHQVIDLHGRDVTDGADKASSILEKLEPLLQQHSDRVQKDIASDPLELDRFSEIRTLLVVMSEALSNLRGSVTALVENNEHMASLIAEQSAMAKDLYADVITARLVPFKNITPRLKKVVRQTSAELGKPINVEIVGEGESLDKNLVDNLAAPMEHILRNSCDHGIEKPDDRRAAGKPAEGTITIRVSKSAAEAIIEVRDDGGGIKTDIIRKKAIEKGLMREDDRLTDREIMQFIMHAGFSTAEKVSQISGRGVGMDVVKTTIQELGGTIEIESERGKSTTFRIRVPVAIGATRVVFVRSGQTLFAIPSSIVDRVEYKEREFFEQEDQTIRTRDGAYRHVHLADLTAMIDNRQGYRSQLTPVLMCRVAGMALAIEVDEALGMPEVAVKPLPPIIQSIQGVFGATETVDGSPVLVLDLATLARDNLAPAGNGFEVRRNRIRLTRQAQRPLAIVVDDSVAMRKAASATLNGMGFDVMTAMDGIAALELLKDNRVPSVILVDVEMPRMDGYELTRAIRRVEKLNGVPVVMITSRSGDDHKEHAMEVGVSRFLSKPVKPLDLQSAVRDLVQDSRVSSAEGAVL